MKAKNARFTTLAAMVVALWTCPAEAQLTLGGMNLEGEVEAGYRLLPDEPSRSRRGKFEEYRDITEAPFLNGVQLRLFRPDESYSTELSGAKWGQEDQEYALRAGRLGRWEFGFDWDQTPHLYSTTARSLFTETDRGVFRLPTPRPALPTWNNAPRTDDISQRWDTARMFLTVTPTPNLEVTAEYTRIHKDGDRPFGMAFGTPGNNFAEMLEPIDQTIHDARLRVAYARDNWQLQFGYTLSIFENALNRVMFDNPCFANAASCGANDGGAAAPATGQSSLPPDNMAHTVTLAGGVNLPFWRTRINGSFAMNIALQNDKFLPHTINPNLSADPDLRLPLDSLHGNLQTYITTLGITAHPLPKLTLSARYRLFDVTDVSGEPIFQAHVVDDRNLDTDPRRAGRFDFRRQNTDLDARYQLLHPVAVTVGAGWERWDRNSHREVPESDEFIGKLAVDVTPNDWMLVRATYRPSFRRINLYNGNAHQEHVVIEDVTAPAAQSIALRKFDEAERDRQRVDLLVQLTPSDALSITPNIGYRYDDYIASTLGLQQETTWSAGIDVAWTPGPRFSASAGFVHEINDQKMRSQYRPNSATNFADFQWISSLADTVDTFHAGLTIAIIPGKVDWTANGNYMMSTGRIETRNPVAPASGTGGAGGSNAVARAKPFPAFEDNFLRLDSALRYHFLKAWTASLGYAFESFQKNDWRTDRLTPFIPGVTSIWLGNDARNYDAHIVGITLAYRFR
jgi:MtrB/PioB family decaheme-associated outer membrane protein